MKILELTPLIQRFNVATPRYTSYPTVPHWEFEGWSEGLWKDQVVQSFRNNNNEISIYIHLPFCEDLCTYCACNKRITKNHDVELPYVEAVLKEWKMYKQLLEDTPVIKEIHLGGGTPTFFSPKHLRALIDGIKAGCAVALQHEFSVEVHPNHMTYDHLKMLADMGFNRVSVGIQDFNPNIQFLINRMQSFEKTQEVIEWSRSLGYDSINVDLVYGLPQQSVADVLHTINKVLQLNADRVAFYSYAHVPWKSKGQRRYTDEDVPGAEAKLEMYLAGRLRLIENGFYSIGMDHFAKREDSLLKAYQGGVLHRNFMGYTTNNHQLLIGLGASSISDTWNAFAQNEKEVEVYQEKVNNGSFPIVDGHILSERDKKIRKCILDLMCNDCVTPDFTLYTADKAASIQQTLQEYDSLGLLRYVDGEVRMMEKGKLFIRNVCAIFDDYLENTTGNVYSKAI